MALLSISPARVAEGPAGSVRFLYFVVSLSTPVQQEVTVDFATAEASGKDAATAGVDYTPRSNQSLTIPAGHTQAIIAVDIPGDAAREADETFDLILSNPRGAGFVMGTTLTAKGTIGEVAPTLSVTAGSVVEGVAGTAATMRFSVKLSAPAEQDVVVHYDSADSTAKNAATAGTDYESISGGVVTIAAGQTSATVAVTVLGDSVKETDEVFQLVFSNPQGAGFSKGSTLAATGTIVDRSPLITVAPTAVTEPTAGAEGEAVFTVRLSAPALQDVTIGYATADGSAANAASAGSDYGAVTGATLTIPQGRSETTIVIAVTGDAVREANETFNLVLSDPSGAGFGKGTTLTAVATIQDHSPTVSVTPAKLTEGGLDDDRSMLFAVTLSAPAAQDVTMRYATQDSAAANAATAGTDYVGVSGGLLTIPAGQSAGYIAVEILGDTAPESNEVFSLVVSDPSGAGFTKGTSLTVNGTIVDDESTPGNLKPEFVLTPAVASERSYGETPRIHFPVILSSPATARVSVRYQTQDGTGTDDARAGRDYVAKHGVLVFQPGETLRYIDVDLIADRRKEPAEEFSISLYAARGAGLTASPAVTVSGTIVDDEPTLTLADTTIREGNRGDLSLLQIPVTLSEAAANPVTVRYQTHDGAGPDPARAGKDYLPSSGILRFEPGETTAFLSVTILGDSRKEADESFEILLSRPKGAGFADGNTLSAGITISDNEPLISASDAAIREGNLGDSVLLRFPIVLSSPATGPVTVRYHTAASDAPDAATLGKDFAKISGQVSFAPGETVAYVDVGITSGYRYEADETFDLILFGARGAGFAEGDSLTVHGTIVNDEPLLTAQAAAIGEGDRGTNDVLSFALFLSEPYPHPVSVVYRTEDGTAKAGLDYFATRGVLIFEPGEMIGYVDVTIRGDDIKESDETFSLILGRPNGAGFAGAVPEITVVGTIVDDEPTIITG